MLIRCLIFAQASSNATVTCDSLGVGPDYAWKREWTNAQQERLFAPAALGSLHRAVFAYGSTAPERAKGLARCSVLGELGRRLLKCGPAHVRLGR